MATRMSTSLRSPSRGLSARIASVGGVVLALLLAGCSGSDSPETPVTSTDPSATSAEPSPTPAEPVTIDVWIADFASAEDMQGLIDRYTAEVAPHVTINYTHLPWQGIDEKVNVAAAGGTFPDLLGASAFQLAPLAVDGLLAPVDEYLAEPDYDFADVPAELQPLGEVDGTPYIFMVGVDTQVLMINRTLFRDAGVAGLIPDETDRSWSRDNFVEAVEAISELPDTYGLGMWDVSPLHDKFLDSFIYNDGDQYTSEGNAEFTFNSSGNVEKYQWLVDVATSEASLPGMTGTTAQNVLDTFMQGNVGVMSHNEGWYGVIQAAIKDGTAAPDLDVMLVHYPTADGSPGAVNAYPRGLVIKDQDDTARQEAAADFAQWLTSGQDEGVNDVLLKKNIPVRASLVDGVPYDELKAINGMQEKVIRPVYAIPDYPQFRAIWFAIRQPLFAPNPPYDAEEALRRFEAEASPLLDRG